MCWRAARLASRVAYRRSIGREATSSAQAKLARPAPVRRDWASRTALAAPLPGGHQSHLPRSPVAPRSSRETWLFVGKNRSRWIVGRARRGLISPPSRPHSRNISPRRRLVRRWERPLGERGAHARPASGHRLQAHPVRLCPSISPPTDLGLDAPWHLRSLPPLPGRGARSRRRTTHRWAPSRSGIEGVGGFAAPHAAMHPRRPGRDTVVGAQAPAMPSVPDSDPAPLRVKFSFHAGRTAPTNLPMWGSGVPVTCARPRPCAAQGCPSLHDPDRLARARRHGNGVMMCCSRRRAKCRHLVQRDGGAEVGEIHPYKRGVEAPY